MKMFVIILISLLSITPVANATSAEVTLPSSTATLTDGPVWLSGWRLHEPKNIDLNTITSLDSALLIMTFAGNDFSYLNGQNAKEFKPVGPGKYEWAFSDANVDYRRTYEVQGETLLVNVSAKFKSKVPEKAYLSLVSHSFGLGDSSDLKNHPERSDREVFYFTESKIERKTMDKAVERSRVLTPLKWFGVGSRYFILTVIPQQTQADEFFYEVVEGRNSAEKETRAALQLPVKNNEVTGSFKLAFVPKRIDALRAIDPSLDLTVDLGFFNIIAYPILRTLRFIYGYVGNYGVAIIILTILIKLLTFPLVVKSMKGMRKMAEFQPKMKALQEKHKDDKAALNAEMMQLMKQSGYNPMAGCFPMLLQMPIFFALYRVLYSAEELYGAPFMFWIKDLSAHDSLYITPILMSLVMFLQQRLTPPSPGMDPAQRKMMMFMPLVFGGFMLATPSGLCVYMLVNAIVSVIQQQYLNKKLGVPGNAASMATSF